MGANASSANQTATPEPVIHYATASQTSSPYSPSYTIYYIMLFVIIVLVVAVIYFMRRTGGEFQHDEDDY